MRLFHAFSQNLNRTSGNSGSVITSETGKSIDAYASKPIFTAKASKSPEFSNAISLKTLGNNLYLNFGFVENPATRQESQSIISNSSVVLSSDTAKQLFCALAELFECEVNPKS